MTSDAPWVVGGGGPFLIAAQERLDERVQAARLDERVLVRAGRVVVVTCLLSLSHSE